MEMDYMTIAVPNVPVQQWGQTYDLSAALAEGTIFPELNKPFFKAPEYSNTTLPKDEDIHCLLYQVGFALDDARLYLDIHPEDEQAKQFYEQCLQKKKELQAICGCGSTEHFEWEKKPLVWEGGHC